MLTYFPDKYMNVALPSMMKMEISCNIPNAQAKTLEAIREEVFRAFDSAFSNKSLRPSHSSLQNLQIWAGDTQILDEASLRTQLQVIDSFRAVFVKRKRDRES